MAPSAFLLCQTAGSLSLSKPGCFESLCRVVGGSCSLGCSLVVMLVCVRALDLFALQAMGVVQTPSKTPRERHGAVKSRDLGKSSGICGSTSLRVIDVWFNWGGRGGESLVCVNRDQILRLNLFGRQMQKKLWLSSVGEFLPYFE